MELMLGATGRVGGTPMRRLLVLLAAGALATVALTSCSGGASGSSSGSGSGSSSRTSIDITIKGGSVTPNGGRVKVRVNTPVTLHIEADAPGEIHVHSTPEQEIEFPRGTSTRRLTIKQPGIVDVEDHALDLVIVQLQAS